jgi:hypothetical protein
LAAAAGFFVLWLFHGREINDRSYFTRDVSATTLIGFKPLLLPDFYTGVIRRILIHLAGPGAAAIAAVGIIVATFFRPGSDREIGLSLAVLSISVFVYYIVFAKANYPHDYYSLIICPHACMLAGFGVAEVASKAAYGRRHAFFNVLFATITIVVTAISLLVFLKKPRLAPDPRLVDLQRLSAGKFEHFAYAMVFVAPDPSLPIPGNVGTDMPQALYATGLRGTARLVVDPKAALAIWTELRPNYRSLRYALFYGLAPPSEIVHECREIIAADEEKKWFACRIR